MGGERIIVTGAAGFIGSQLAERLLARGDRVIGVDNFDPFYSRAEKRRNLAAAAGQPGFRFAHVDIAEPDALEHALGDEPVDAIVHLAAKAGVRPSIRDPLGYVRANLTGTQVLLEWARRHGVHRVVFASSSSVYGNSTPVPFVESEAADRPISPYAATKRAGELLCQTYQHLHGMRIIALRFFTVYGPRQRPDLAIRDFATRILRGQPIYMYGDGSSERDYTWVEDVLDGTVAALDRTRDPLDQFEVVNIGGNRTTRLDRLIELIGEAAGVRPIIERREPQPGDVLRTCASLERAHALLGYAPRTPIEEGIPRFVTWLRASGSF